MKRRNYVFKESKHNRSKYTIQQIVESLQALARERNRDTFTQKEYDSWKKRLLSSHQVAVIFGSWAKAMEKANLDPGWGFTKDPTEMVEIFMDCWEENDSAPNEKVFEQYLRKINSKYSVMVYKRYFGGYRRLIKKIIDFQSEKISEAQLTEKYIGRKKNRKMISAGRRHDVFKRDRYRCAICGKSSKEDDIKLEVDHIIPVAEGGTDDLDNLQTLCIDCNRGKKDKI